MLIHFLQNMKAFEKDLERVNMEEQEERKIALYENFVAWKDELGVGKGKEKKVKKI